MDICVILMHICGISLKNYYARKEITCRIGQKIYRKITEPKFVKLSTTIALIVATTSIIIGVIVAMIGPLEDIIPLITIVV
ncbi:MAG: hypothetical protein EU533_05790 [Promethearchaeota archaeon]|nr:MAG: hypothetical protein EU533_05790 [Candidatus Lokiarchaeota archaeon]